MASSRPLLENGPEIGSLTASSPCESHFIGSSSGVYFINTVKKAFASSGQSSNSVPAAAETVGGTEDFASSSGGTEDDESVVNRTLHIHDSGPMTVSFTSNLGILPPKDIARRLGTEFFRFWHPLFPFLAGPQFLEDLNALYADHSLHAKGNKPINRQQVCKLITFRCVFDIGATHVSPATLSQVYTPISASEIFAVVTSVAIRHDLGTIQAVMAAQLASIAKMALRTASSLGGILLRLIMHAGLHRCPYRYPQLSNENRELRKRVFWTAYVLDRYLSQALGLPLMISDTDIDVCMPTAREVHTPRPVDHAMSDAATLRNAQDTHQQQTSDKAPREIVLANYIEYCRLVGRALELYHKSIHVRAIRQEQALYLRSDIDRWFNHLPEDLQVTPFSSGVRQEERANLGSSRFAVFFVVLYQQLVVLVNRPSLSLQRSLPEFQSGLQATLSAARATLVALEQHSHLAWPGSLPAVWMSGLIIAFACQVGHYDTSKGSQYVCHPDSVLPLIMHREIRRCVDLLKAKIPTWPTAQRCCSALSTLLEELQRTSFGRDRVGSPLIEDPSDRSVHRKSPSSLNRSSDESSASRKRQRYNTNRKNPERPNTYGWTASSSASRLSSSHAPGWQPSGSSNFPVFLGQSNPYAQDFAVSHPLDAVEEPSILDANDLFQDVAWENLFGITGIDEDFNIQ